jgi:hypothetical protein
MEARTTPKVIDSDWGAMISIGENQKIPRYGENKIINKANSLVYVIPTKPFFISGKTPGG